MISALRWLLVLSLLVADASKKKSGRDEAKKKNRQRTDYFKVYGRPDAPLELNDQEFRLTALRRDLGNIPIDRLTESFEWRDEGTEDGLNTIPVLRGSLTLRKPHPDSPGGDVEINPGHIIRCEVRWGGRWMEVWRMRIQKPTVSLDGGWTHELADDLILAAESEASFRYVRGKRHKKGWYYHEIVKDIARQYRIPLGQIAKGKHRIKRFTHAKISPLEAIRLAVQEEHKHEHRHLVIRWQYDKARKRSALTILPLRRNKTLYRLAKQIRTADITETPRGRRATALIVRGHQKRKDGTRKKIRTRVVDAQAVRKYGYIQKDYNAGVVDSLADARREAKLRIARFLKPKKTIENLSHSGIAWVRRGDAVQVVIPDEGFKGDKSVMFVVSVAHQVSGGDYTMNLTLGLTDPVEKSREQREKAIRAQKRRAKKKKES